MRDLLDVEFTGEVWHWRGPSPFYFITVPVEECTILKEEWTFASYGWGMIPVTASIGRTVWDTSLFSKDGSYVVPLKDAVRGAEELDEGDVAHVQLTLRLTSRARRTAH